MIMKLLMEHGSDVMAQTKEVRATTYKKYWAGKHSGTADLHAQWMTKNAIVPNTKQGTVVFLTKNCLMRKKFGAPER